MGMAWKADIKPAAQQPTRTRAASGRAAPLAAPRTIVVTAPLPRRQVRPSEPSPSRSAPNGSRSSRCATIPTRSAAAFETGDYPYKIKVTESHYLERMLPLQAELLKAQNWVKEAGEKIVVLFEGRDAAGKGGTIKRFMEHLNPRGARIVALEKPNERERTPMVLPALHPAPAGRRGNRVLRPLLVQPRRGRAGDGFLQAQRISRVHAPVPGARAHAGALGHPACTSTGSQ